MRNLLINSILITIIGCSSGIENQNSGRPNYDSLFNIGDSVLRDMYIEQAKQRMYHDSLNGKVSTYQIQLNEKRTFEAQQRRIYKDTIIYNTRTKTITDTVFKHVYLTDTIRDTIFVTKRELKRRRNGN